MAFKTKLHLLNFVKARFKSTISNEVFKLTPLIYNFKLLEEGARKKWNTVPTSKPTNIEKKQALYILPMFPYPSGSLHMGHVRVYTIPDVIARASRMKGHDVLFPIGWDSFGLPAENAAIERGVDPADWTKSNIQEMKIQLENLSISFDWDRELATSKKDYYGWTQWLFLKLHEKGLAYEKEAMVNWDPVDKTVLANEQVDNDGKSWRSGAIVEQKSLKQWFFNITSYANRLIEPIENGSLLKKGWPKQVLHLQKQWIGIEDDGTMNLHDWLVSRQRFWGTPIPIINCVSCGSVPEKEQNLPVSFPREIFKLPRSHVIDIIQDQNKDDLSVNDKKIADFFHVNCPKCSKPATRSIDTLDTFVDSSFYYLRFCDPHNSSSIFKAEKVLKWMKKSGVDVYIGGIEHAVLHLLYARFINKFVLDLGLISNDEPFSELITQGMVLGKSYVTKSGRYLNKIEQENYEEGQEIGEEVEIVFEKMSKSKHNGINPNELVEICGTDVLRLFILFAAPPSKELLFDSRNLNGQIRFVNKAFNIINDSFPNNSGLLPLEALMDSSEAMDILKRTNETVLAVDHHTFETHSFNVAISELMKMLSFLGEIKSTHESKTMDAKVLAAASYSMETFVLLLAPYAPNLAEHLWEKLGEKKLRSCKCSSVFEAPYPTTADVGSNSIMSTDVPVKAIVQVKGKRLGDFDFVFTNKENDNFNEILVKRLKLQKKVSQKLGGNKISRTIIVPTKHSSELKKVVIVNFVI